MFYLSSMTLYHPDHKPAFLMRMLAYTYGAGRIIHKIIMGMQAQYFDTPHIICIGNVTAGGGGKTPITMAVYTYIQTHHPDKKCLIISKGYKRKKHGMYYIDETHTPLQCGDEPYLYFKKNMHVMVCTNRRAAIAKAAQDQYDIIILDDGFQDQTIKPHNAFLVIDGHTGIGNGHLLPAGPLREPPKAAYTRADLILVLNGPYIPQTDKTMLHLTPTYEYGGIQKDHPCFAFAGIARPEKFYDSLHTQGIQIQSTMDFPDHHHYCQNDENMILENANGVAIITTEKDFVKLSPSMQDNVHVQSLTYTIPADAIKLS